MNKPVFGDVFVLNNKLWVVESTVEDTGLKLKHVFLHPDDNSILVYNGALLYLDQVAWYEWIENATYVGWRSWEIGVVD